MRIIPSQSQKRSSQVYSIHRRKLSGFTMVETVVAIGVLGIFFAAVAAIIQIVLQNITESRIRAVALTLAQQKMEAIRNLPYSQVGTTGGIPQGTLMQTETVTLNNLAFIVSTSIIYIDDPFDGLAPSDLINTDYKRVRTEITWDGAYPSRSPVTLVTNIVPKGVETIAGGGTLFIQVFNSNGLPVSNATVKIDNTVVNPQVHTQTLTNTNGLVVIPGAPACITCYQIESSKTNYSTDRTYSSSEVTNPLQPYATVLEGQLTQLSLAIDQVSSLIVNSLGGSESGYPPVSNVQFTLRGTKTIGTDTLDNPVYKYSFQTNTGGGTVSIPALEWDTYTLDFTNSFHNVAGSNPTLPFALAPNVNLTLQVVAVAKTNTSFLLTVKNSANELQASATAQLTNTGLSYNQIKITSATGSADFGQVFFGSLVSNVYDLKITLPGYQDATASFYLSGINQDTITLNPAP